MDSSVLSELKEYELSTGEVSARAVVWTQGPRQQHGQRAVVSTPNYRVGNDTHPGTRSSAWLVAGLQGKC